MSDSPHPLHFGVEMMEPFEGLSWAESARELEALGYSTLFAPDHFDEGLGPLTAMAAAAAATTELRVATAVFAADFRHPAVLARELASIDLLSEGRLEVGLGAGYQVNDYRASGIPMDPPKVRVDRLIEYVAVLRGLFAEGPFSYAGEHFQIDALDGSPHPFTPGSPPIFVAGGGPRMLRFAARHADIVGVNPALPTSERREEARRDGVAARVDEKFTLIREAAGERYENLVFHGWLQAVVITDDGREAAADIGAALGGLDADDVLESPFVLIGSVEEIVARLLERRERWGYSYYTVQQPSARDFAQVLAALG